MSGRCCGRRHVLHCGRKWVGNSAVGVALHLAIGLVPTVQVVQNLYVQIVIFEIRQVRLHKSGVRRTGPFASLR
jgi:hypothetical protein